MHLVIQTLSYRGSGAQMDQTLTFTRSNLYMMIGLQIIYNSNAQTDKTMLSFKTKVQGPRRAMLAMHAESFSEPLMLHLNQRWTT